MRLVPDAVRRWWTRPLAPGPTFSPIELREALGATPVAWTVGQPTWPDLTNRTRIDQGYSISTTIYACVALRARCLSAATVRVYREREGDQVDEPTHRLRRLMRRPNGHQSEAEFFALVSTIADVANFCVVEKERSQAGNVVGLWPLRSDWLRPIPRDQTAPDWEYRIPGRDPAILPARDAVVYTVAASPEMPWTGFGPMNVVFREAATDKAITDYVKAFFDAGALPAYALIPRDVPNIQPPEANALRDAWMQTIRRGIPPFLAGIEDVKTLGFDFNELAYPELRKVTEQHICTAFGVPTTLIGTAGAENEATYANATTYLRQFYWTTIEPLWSRLDGALTRSLLPEFGDPELSLEFDTSGIPALQEDRTPHREQLIKLWQTGVVVRDEVREEFGYDALDAHPDPEMAALGGAFYRPPTPAAFAPVGEPDEDGEGARSLPALPAGARAALNGHARLVEPRALVRLAPEVRATTAAGTRRAIEALTAEWAPRLARFWREQGERITETALRSSWGTTEPHKGIPPETRNLAEVDWDEEAELFDAFMRRMHADGVGTAWGAAGDVVSLDTAFDVSNPYVDSVLDRLAKRIAGINATTRDDVRRVVGEALSEGVSPEQLADRLRGLFTETYANRAMTVARTESQLAYNSGAAAAYRASGEVDRVELADNPAHDTDPFPPTMTTCADRDGLLAPLHRAEAYAESAHPNCILAVLPVLSVPLGEE